MTKVMISYSNKDKRAASALASSLTAFGIKVWWDIGLKAGHSFAREIDAVIRNADYVVVLWSPDSVQSEWVVAEASLAKDLGKLVPAKIADCDPLVNFRALHTLRLHWMEATERFEELGGLVASVKGSIFSVERTGSISHAEYSATPAQVLVLRTLRTKSIDALAMEGLSNIESKWLYAVALSEGIGIKSDRDQAFRIFSDCAKAGFKRALHSLAAQQINHSAPGPPPKTAIDALRQASDAGVALSQCLLGTWHIHGRNVPKDEPLGFRLLQRSALGGCLDGKAELALCYHKGRGVPKDFKEALHWYEQAASDGEPFAIAMLAAIAADGEYPGHGDDYVAKMFEASYHAGRIVSAISLAEFFAEPGRPIYDPARALFWFKKAGESGLPEGHFKAARLLSDTGRQAGDVSEIRYLLAQASDAGYGPALVFLGDDLLVGLFGPKKVSDAKSAYSQALACKDLSASDRARASEGLKRAREST